ncbi:MAG TPA: S8 family serine peptidase [Candidatus Elarobacter sp.]|nr:S8 family serine peptidase [Candidatus Elarobacter sp.]
MSSKLFGACALALALGITASAGDARPYRRPAAVPLVPASQRVAFMGYLHDGRTATVYTDGRVTITPTPSARPRPAGRAGLVAALRTAATRTPSSGRTMQTYIPVARYGTLDDDVAPNVRRRILFDLEHPPQRVVPGSVIVVFKPGVTATQDLDALTPAATLSLRRTLLSKRGNLTPHSFTTDAHVNRTLMNLGVDRVQRLLSGTGRAALAAMRGRAESRVRRSLLAFDNAFVVHASASTVAKAVRALRAEASVAYAEPDYAVAPMTAERRAIPADAVREIAGYRRAPRAFGRSTRSTAPPQVPSNAAVSFNVQAFLDAPGVDAIAAFDEIGQRFGQLPGTGEIVTNVGVGDVDDASAASNPNDPCHDIVAGIGPTTHLIGGQRYLDLPSMPLIPVWVSDTSGTLSATTEVCNVDPSLGEVGLDFSVMAPLPHEQQRPGEIGAGATDLLGIAPGASYRWVAPGAADGVVGIGEALTALIAAARQQPAPNVITASIGFGADGEGFPSRYLEDDPLAQSIVASIVASNVVVCLAANDGTRLFTGAAIGPSGGSAATNSGTTGTTTIDDLYTSTAPSVVPDSGAIDVGGTTLNEAQTYPETRFNGMLGFSSGFGSRVNIAAPSDNIESLYLAGGGYDAVGTGLAGGTSASSPEVAAAAAVALQVARLTGHPFTSATQVRDALVATGTPVVNAPQSDVPLNVGPQVSVRRIVEQLLAASGKPVQPAIARVAVHGRRSGSFIATTNTRYVNDATFVSALDPSYIKLDGPYTVPRQSHSISFPGTDTGAELESYITIAPDWEAIPANATFRLTVAGQPGRVIATTPSARLLPAQLFAAAGVPLTPGVSRTLSLTYTASVGLHAVAESTFQLTFGPPAASSRLVLAPQVPPVVSGSTIPVTYDIGTYPTALLRAPVLNVSMPDTGSAWFTEVGLYPYYSVPLTATHGTVNVPVSALAGAGTYTIWIDLNPGLTQFQSDYSDLAFTRVDAGSARPPAPLLSYGANGAKVHSLSIPYKGTFDVSYDVSQVPNATGAIVELSAPPPSPFFYSGFYGPGNNTFRNPNGNQLDDDGVVSGSIYHVATGGTTGTIAIDAEAAKIPVTSSVNVRVIPTAAGTPVAEASDADTLTYEGIASGLGTPISTLFLNPNGTDGYLGESAEVYASQSVNVPLYTFEPFDLGTGAVGSVALTTTTPTTSYNPIVQNDANLVSTSLDLGSIQNYLAAPIGAGYATYAFPPGTMPASAIVVAVAPTSSANRSAYIGIDFANAAVIVTRGDVTTGTGFSPGIDITSSLNPNIDGQAIAAFNYDPGLDRAYMVMEDETLDCTQQSPQFLTVDFATGTTTVRTLPIAAGKPGLGDGYQFAIDPATHVAAIATYCTHASSDTAQAELSILDLQNGAVSQVFHHTVDPRTNPHGFPGMPGGDSQTIGIDAVNHLILQRSMFCPELVGTADLNARPCLRLYDESGQAVKTIPRLFADGFLDEDTVFNGVNPAIRTGVADGQQPNPYYIFSYSVQPYTY